jgi:hypothetical protein
VTAVQYEAELLRPKPEATAETDLFPNSELTMEVELSGGYRTDSTPRELRQLVPETMTILSGYETVVGENGEQVRWLPPDDKVNWFLKHVQSEHFTKIGEEVIVYPFQNKMTFLLVCLMGSAKNKSYR